MINRLHPRKQLRDLLHLLGYWPSQILSLIVDYIPIPRHLIGPQIVAIDSASKLVSSLSVAFIPPPSEALMGIMVKQVKPQRCYPPSPIICGFAFDGEVYVGQRELDDPDEISALTKHGYYILNLPIPQFTSPMSAGYELYAPCDKNGNELITWQFWSPLPQPMYATILAQDHSELLCFGTVTGGFGASHPVCVSLPIDEAVHRSQVNQRLTEDQRHQRANELKTYFGENPMSYQAPYHSLHNDWYSHQSLVTKGDFSKPGDCMIWPSAIIRRPPCPFKDAGASVTVHQGHHILLYSIGGQQYPSKLAYVYSSLVNEWTELPSLPAELKAAVCYWPLTNQIFVLGQTQRGKIMMLAFHIDLRTWSNLESPPLPTYESQLVAIPAISGVLALGGCRDNCSVAGRRCSGYVNIINFYDPSSNTWRISSWSLPVPMKNFGCQFFDGFLYVIGGTEDNVCSSKCYRVHVSSEEGTSKWQRLPDLPFACHQLSCVVV